MNVEIRETAPPEGKQYLAGMSALHGFRWHELLKRAAPQPKPGYPEIEVVPN